MARGKLEKLTVRPTFSKSTGRIEDCWRINLLFDDKQQVNTLSNRISLTVLQTALIGHPAYGSQQPKRWPIEIDVVKGMLYRVRIFDDRENIDPAQFPSTDLAYPLSPTSFADEDPVKWGFFFIIEQKLMEYKGLSLDVYFIIERAWEIGNFVRLTLDGSGLIIEGASIETP